MHPQLDAIVAEFESAQVRLHRLVDPMPEERWAARADPARWSVAECVAHLNLTARAYIPLIQGGLKEGRELGRTVPNRYRRDLVGWLVALATGPLPRFGRIRLGRVRTTPGFVPSGELPRTLTVAEFDQLQEEQIALTRAAEGLPLHAIYVTSPFEKRVRYNLYACLTMLPRHQSRHLWQAEEVWGESAAVAATHER
jgi:hypothetical protein